MYILNFYSEFCFKLVEAELDLILCMFFLRYNSNSFGLKKNNF